MVLGGLLVDARHGVLERRNGRKNDRNNRPPSFVHKNAHRNERKRAACRRHRSAHTRSESTAHMARSTGVQAAAAQQSTIGATRLFFSILLYAPQIRPDCALAIGAQTASAGTSRTLLATAFSMRARWCGWRASGAQCRRSERVAPRIRSLTKRFQTPIVCIYKCSQPRAPATQPTKSNISSTRKQLSRSTRSSAATSSSTSHRRSVRVGAS